MGTIIFLIDIFLHLDKYLAVIMQNYGLAVYPLLFLVVLFETGLVVTPFLPGDSLLFIAGTIASENLLNIGILFILFLAAAILGDSLNYTIGNLFGEKVFVKRKLIKQEHLDKTKEFYKKYGGKTIFLGRFIPIVRTFAPFVAGVSKMNYSRFLMFNILGAIVWVILFLFSGYFFGKIPFVQNNLSFFIILIIFISILPAIIAFLKHKKKK